METDLNNISVEQVQYMYPDWTEEECVEYTKKENGRIIRERAKNENNFKNDDHGKQ